MKKQLRNKKYSIPKFVKNTDDNLGDDMLMSDRDRKKKEEKDEIPKVNPLRHIKKAINKKVTLLL